jgi:hypothetical protein
MITTKYVTEDGTEFDELENAKEHEKNLKARTRLIEINNGKILSKEDILNYFERVYSDGCKKCPFKPECDNVYQATRRHSTDTFVLCSAIENAIEL